MGIISRSNKPSGGTNWQDSDIVAGSGSGSSDINTDVNTAYNEFNGGIENVNIKATAGIVGTKLASGTLTDTQINASAGIDPTKINDRSANDAQQVTLSDPGDSDSNTLATNLAEEIEQLRHEIKKLSVGVSAKITDGLSSGLGANGKAAWFDGGVIGPSVIRNGSFLDAEAESTGPTAPYGWSVVDGGGGGPSTLTPVTLDVAEGKGHAIHMVDSNDVGRDGISQTLAGLKASSRYLVVARIKPITTTWKLTTTGAIGTFGNLNLSTASGGSLWETLAGIIETDSTPTDIVVNLIAGNAQSACHAALCSCYSIDGDFLDRTTNLVRHKKSNSTDIPTIISETEISVVVPAQGLLIRVDARIFGITSGPLGGALLSQLREDVDGGGFTTVDYDTKSGASGVTTVASVRHLYIRDTIPGSVYTYKLIITVTLNMGISTNGGGIGAGTTPVVMSVALGRS